MTDANLKVVGTTPDGDGVVFDFVFGDVTEQLTCNTLGEYSSSTDLIVCKDGAHATTLSKYFTENPLLFKTADGTVY